MGLDSAETRRGYNVNRGYSGAVLGCCVGLLDMTFKKGDGFRHVEKLPEYCNYLKPDSELKASDIAKIYGIKECTLHDRISRGQFPPPTHKWTRGDKHLKPRFLWRWDVVLKHMAAEIQNELE